MDCYKIFFFYEVIKLSTISHRYWFNYALHCVIFSTSRSLFSRSILRELIGVCIVPVQVINSRIKIISNCEIPRVIFSSRREAKREKRFGR